MKKTLYDLINQPKGVAGAVSQAAGEPKETQGPQLGGYTTPGTPQMEAEAPKPLQTYNPAPQMDAETPKPLGTQQEQGQAPQMSVDDFYNLIKASAPEGGIGGAISGAVMPGYADTANNLLAQIENREPFNFNLNGNALYQMYRDLYMRNGQQAMKNTQGQAAGLTGGYGSSYAQAVGNQAYNDYLTKLNQIVPDLYDRERAAYDKETQDLYNRYNIYSELENRQYNRQQAEQSRQDDLEWKKWQQAQADLDRQEAQENRDWNRQQAEIDRAEDRENRDWNRAWQERQLDIDQENTAWNRQQAERNEAYERVRELLSYNIMPSADLLEKAGITQEEANQMRAYMQYLANIGPAGGGRGSGGRGSGRSSRSGSDESDYESDYDAVLASLAANTANAGILTAYDAIVGLGKGNPGVPQDEYSAIRYQIQKMKSDGVSTETILAWLQKYGRVSDQQYNELMKLIGG